MRPRVVPPPCPPPRLMAPTPNRVMSLRMFWRPNRPSSRPARICDPSFKPRVRYTCRMSIWAPACTDVPTNASCELPPFWICGANPKWMPRFMPASLPLASNVAKVGSSPVRMLELAALPAVAFSLVKIQNTFTFPENENDQPFDICIVRPCALAVAVTPSARLNNSNVRRFIREPLLGSWPARCLLVWLLTYACRVTDLIRKSGADLLLRAGGRRGRRPECSRDPKASPACGRPWPRIPQNIGYDPPLNAIAGWFSAPCRFGSRYDGRVAEQAAPGATGPVGRRWGHARPRGGVSRSDCVVLSRREIPPGGLGLRLGLRQPEHEQRIAERIADLEVPARCHGHELLAVDLEHRGRGVGAGAAVELPQHRTGLGVVRLEPAVALAREHQAARRGGRAAHHRQLGLLLPGDLAGVE